MATFSRNEPRTYIKPIPPYNHSDVGIRIQARSDTVYNPSLPTRQQIREDNYKRRTKQLTEQGFQTPKHKPYHGIGDPFYLSNETKKLVLTALGQFNNQEDDAATSSNDILQQQTFVAQPAVKKPLTYFILKKSSANLQGIPTELCHGQDRPVVKTVKLGRDFFRILKDEENLSSEQQRREEEEQRRKLRTEPQPAIIEASSDETDIECDSHEDETKRKVTRKSAKIQLSLRPFTPVHSSIDTAQTSHNRDVLFRQLCALHWLLQAMHIIETDEDLTTMNPITTAWSQREVGGNHGKVDRKKVAEKIEGTWRSFAIKPTTLKVNNNRPWRGNITRKRSIASAHPSYRPTGREFGSSAVIPLTSKEAGISNSLLTPQTSREAGNSSLTPHNDVNDNQNVPSSSDDDDLNHQNNPDIKIDSVDQEECDEEEDNFSKYKSQFKFLDEYYDSKDKDEIPPDERDDRSPSVIESSRSGKTGSMVDGLSHKHQRYDDYAENLGKPIPDFYSLSYLEKMDIIRDIEKLYNDRKLHELTNLADKNIRLLRGSKLVQVKPQTAAFIAEFKASLPSAKLENIKEDLRQNFAEVYHARALLLHDRLDAAQREKYRKIKSKYQYLDTSHTNFQKAVKFMRRSTAKDERELKAAKQRELRYQEWYKQLELLISDQLKGDWLIKRILYRIQKFGLVDEQRPSARKFFRVLKELRDWELCAPDIIAAIEFCREFIIEVPAEEFDEWFNVQFATIPQRPQTAPLIRSPQVTTIHESDDKNMLTVQRGIKINSRHSAPACGRKQ